MIKDLNAADIMTKKLITFTPDTQVLKAIDKLISYRIFIILILYSHDAFIY